MRYMWVPYSDTVVVVRSDYAQGEVDEEEEAAAGVGAQAAAGEEEEAEAAEAAAGALEAAAAEAALAPLRALLRELRAGGEGGEGGGSSNFAELRDELLSAGEGPLDPDHVKVVNRAEAEFWAKVSVTS